MYPGKHAQVTPDKLAVIMARSGRTLTYAELDDNSARIARVFHDLGLRRGDVVAILSDNAPECLEVYWAALRSGLYVTALNYHLSPVEATYILEDSDAKVLITSARVAPLARAVVETTPGIVARLSFGGVIEGHLSYEEARAGAGPRLADQPRGADMLYSSGTTGRPKGVKPPLPELNVDQPGDVMTGLTGALFGFTADDVYLSPAPLYHAAPLRWSAATHAHGGTVVIMEKFDAEEALRIIENRRITVVQVVPTMFVRMLQLPAEVRARYDTSSLRLAIHAAAPCPPDVKERMIDWWGPILIEYYGSTEGAGLTVITSKEWVEKRGSVGRSALGPIHVCDDAGKELPDGRIGSIYFERETAVFEYHKDPEKTRSARHPLHENWSNVGDIGYVDADGFVFLTDRKSFTIISGGVNIYPQEVENVLTLHPDVHDVAVIGIPDAEMGQQVKAVVQLRAGLDAAPWREQELIDYVRARVAHFKAPRSVDFVDTLPRTPTGKLVKRELTQRYIEASR